MIVEKQLVAKPPAAFGEFTWWRPGAADLAVPIGVDDWPYLGLRDRRIPPGYVLVILSLLVISVVAIARLKPPGSGAEDLHFAAMGVGFLLLETKSIVDASLYFGTTWIVSLIVIAGVLLMVLLANAVATRIRGFTSWLYAPLIGSIMVLFAMPTNVILSMSLRRPPGVDHAGDPDSDFLRGAGVLRHVQAHGASVGRVRREPGRGDGRRLCRVPKHGDRAAKLGRRGHRRLCRQLAGQGCSRTAPGRGSAVGGAFRVSVHGV